MAFANNLQSVAAVFTVATSDTISAAVALGGARVLGIQMPATWTAAALTFLGSVDGSTYQSIYDSAGSEVSITAVQAHYVALPDTSVLAGLNYLKVRSGTVGSPVQQAADRTLVLLVRGL